MKSDKGVTTASLIVYVLAMLIVIGIIANLTSFFYNNVIYLQDNSSNIATLTKFNMYFLGETKNRNNQISTVNTNTITFSTGNTFTFQDNSIYYNSIKICEDIQNAEFKTEVLNSKTIISVLITVGDVNEYTKTTKYVLAKQM